MTDRPIQPDDFELLISRALDGELPPAEQQRLEAALAASPELRRQAEQYAALHGLLDRFAAHDQAPVHRSIEESVVAALASAAEHDKSELEGDSARVAGVDRLLAGYARSVVDLNWDAFAAGVMQRIEPGAMAAADGARGGFRSRRSAWLLGVPLAAAAALALAVTIPWFTRNDGGGTSIVENRVLSPDGGARSVVTITENTTDGEPTLGGPDDATVAPAMVRVADVSIGRTSGVSEVSFGREPAPGWSPPVRSTGVGYAAVSFAAAPRGGDGFPF